MERTVLGFLKLNLPKQTTTPKEKNLIMSFLFLKIG